MNTEALQVSRILESVSRALAQWTLARHAEADPTLLTRYGERGRTDWLANIESRLAYLAQALAVQRPEVFVASVLWSREALTARAAELGDLVTSVRCLGEVIAAELPPPVAGVASDCVRSAVAVLAQAPANADSPLSSLPARAREPVLRYVESLLTSQADAATDQIMTQARAGVPIPTLYVQILHPAMAEIGRMWHCNEISIADEHYATAATRSLMSRLRALATPERRRGLRAVAAAVGGDHHEIGIRMVADCLELDGWEVTYLGANLPAGEAAAAVRERSAHLLALSASTFLHLRDTGELIAAVRGEPGCTAVKIMVGGPPFQMIPDLWRQVGADGHAASATEAVSLAAQLLAAAA